MSNGGKAIIRLLYVGKIRDTIREIGAKIVAKKSIPMIAQSTPPLFPNRLVSKMTVTGQPNPTHRIAFRVLTTQRGSGRTLMGQHRLAMMNNRLKRQTAIWNKLRTL
jgi:hypothetical protein